MVCYDDGDGHSYSIAADTFLVAGRVAASKGELCFPESTNEEILYFPELRPASSYPL